MSMTKDELSQYLKGLTQSSGEGNTNQRPARAHASTLRGPRPAPANRYGERGERTSSYQTSAPSSDAIDASAISHPQLRSGRRHVRTIDDMVNDLTFPMEEKLSFHETLPDKGPSIQSPVQHQQNVQRSVGNVYDAVKERGHDKTPPATPPKDRNLRSTGDAFEATLAGKRVPPPVAPKPKFDSPKTATSPSKSAPTPPVPTISVPTINIPGAPDDDEPPSEAQESSTTRLPTNSALRCAGCQKAISGIVITAMNKRWHPQCFVCKHCKIALEHVSFFEKDGLPYCHLDYHELFSPRCAYCNTPIEDRCITALGKSYHPGHFFCRECGVPFDEGGFMVHDGHAYCEKDYQRKFGKTCKGCGEYITSEFVHALGGDWHQECFVCEVTVSLVSGTMSIVSVHDREVILNLLHRDPVRHVYHLGDLDDTQFRKTVWYAFAETEEAPPVDLVLIFLGLEVPVVLSTHLETPNSVHFYNALVPYLPRSFYAHLVPDFKDALKGYRIVSHGPHYRMALIHKDRIIQVDTAEIIQLTLDDEKELGAFYNEHYPGNAFNRRMLETGSFFGVRVDSALVCAAGLHVMSPRYGVAAIGTVTTSQVHRNKGWAAKTSAALCQHVLQRVEHIGLNVQADNAPAIACYRKLGFEVVGEYEEAMCFGNAYAFMGTRLFTSGDKAKQQTFLDQLRDALLHVGFFILKNHGIDEGLQSRMVDEARKFFALPLEEKIKIDMIHSPHFRGYTRMGAEVTDFKHDNREQIDLGLERPAPSPGTGRLYYENIQGPNQWPNAELVPDFRPTCMTFMDACIQVARKLMEAMALVLGLEHDWFRPMFGEDDEGGYGPHVRMKVVRYPSMTDEKDKPEAHGLGVGPHKDYGFLTILMQDDVGGLQVQSPQGEWIDATPIPNTFIINVGETFERATQRCFKATTHRVLNNSSGKDRISVPVFFNPAVNAKIPFINVSDEIKRLTPQNVISDIQEGQLLQKEVYGENAFAINVTAPVDLSSAYGSVSTPPSKHYQKQLTQYQITRQCGSPHYHARTAAAAAKIAANLQNSSSSAVTITDPSNPARTINVSKSKPKDPSTPAEGNPASVDNDKSDQPWTSMDMGGMGLKTISVSLYQNFEFLTTLYLNHNNFTELRPEIGRLKQLELLDLSANKLASIPPELGMLVKLKELLLFDNNLSTVPNELGSLYHLETLGLEGNPLQEPYKGLLVKEGTKALISFLKDSCPVPMPPPEREWIPIEGSAMDDSKEKFTVFCYNILSERCATTQ
ncbi:hypothetical protein BZG36_04216, partial [Bifiguratus adelaidae]